MAAVSKTNIEEEEGGICLDCQTSSPLLPRFLPSMDNIPPPPMLIRAISEHDWTDGIKELNNHSHMTHLTFKQSGNWTYQVARVGDTYYGRIYLKGELVSERDCKHLTAYI